MKTQAADPVELAIFQCAVHSIAEEMGAALKRTALSPNIKERRDYSCAVFDGRGRAIAMGDHTPVHLGSMPMSVQAAIAVIEFAPGDIAILNDPYAGGTHLPDITMVLPVFVAGGSEPAFYVANRAHHADVGGKFAGSMGTTRDLVLSNYYMRNYFGEEKLFMTGTLVCWGLILIALIMIVGVIL